MKITGLSERAVSCALSVLWSSADRPERPVPPDADEFFNTTQFDTASVVDHVAATQQVDDCVGDVQLARE